MKTHSKCEKCKHKHSVHSLILTHGKLLCRICHIEECGRIPIPPKKVQQRASKVAQKLNENGDAE